jgi:putative ABC transport system substrate-binding protein
MRRRELITLLGGAAAWPLAARAQQPGLPVIGYLGSETADRFASRLLAFHEGLSEMGYVEGRNVAIEYRWADEQEDRLPTLAAELVRRQVTVLAAPGSTSAALAAKAATPTIPVVFATVVNPVEFGLIASLNRPGGNLTGVTLLSVELGPKRLELLHEMVPTATVMALLVYSASPFAETLSRDAQAAAQALGLRLHVLYASTESDFHTVFETLTQLRAGALVIGPDTFFNSRAEQLAGLALRNRVPTVSQFQFAAAGGLMSYGGNLMDGHRLAGIYVGRILKGEKPADLPVQQATKVELIINLKTAKALGLTVPLALLGRADEVIE